MKMMSTRKLELDCELRHNLDSKHDKDSLGSESRYSNKNHRSCNTSKFHKASYSVRQLQAGICHRNVLSVAGYPKELTNQSQLWQNRIETSKSPDSVNAYSGVLMHCKRNGLAEKSSDYNVQVENKFVNFWHKPHLILIEISLYCWSQFYNCIVRINWDGFQVPNFPPHSFVCGDEHNLAPLKIPWPKCASVETINGKESHAWLYYRRPP